MNSSYGLDLYITGTDLDYFDRIIKYITSSKSTIKDISDFCRAIDQNMFRNEHFLAVYYTKYLNSIQTISKVDLGLMVKLTEIDKTKIESLPQINLTGVVDVREEFKGDFIVDMVKSYKDKIDKITEVTEEDYKHSLNLIKELTKDLKANNLLFVGSRILNDDYRMGRKVLKGREDFFQFMTDETRGIKEMNEDIKELVETVNREFVFSNMYSAEPLFPHPIKALEDAWGWIKRGETLSVLAPMSVGKTTLTINYMAEALIHGVNVALFISEMNIDSYISRVVSIIGAKKYKIFLASDTVHKYLTIKHLEFNNKEVSEVDKSFLSKNGVQVNNIEYILTQLFADSKEDLGTMHIVDKLNVEEVPDLYNSLLEKEVYFFAVDHINGVTSSNPRYKGSELTNDAYVTMHNTAKKTGVATVFTNHVPDEYIPILNDPMADKSEVRGSNGGQSTKSVDNVLLMAATDEQKSNGEMVLMTNKSRNDGIFFEAILLAHRKEIGLLYEADIHLQEGEEDNDY